MDPDAENRYNAETLPLPKDMASKLGLEAEQPIPPAVPEAEPPSPATEPAASQLRRGPADFRQLTNPTDDPIGDEELLEQVPDDMREVLAARLKAADEEKQGALREETVESLKARGYQVTEDARGARITGGSSRSTDFSPHEMVRMAAEQEGGVQPRGKLPICPECQAASPIGSANCQWCGAELPQD